MAEPVNTTGLVLEDVLEQAGRLQPLLKAAAAWRANKKHIEWAEKHHVPLDESLKGIQPAYERELAETTAYFTQLLARRERAIEIRPWGRFDMPWTQLQPGNAPWLSIDVRPDGKSLTLHRPDGKRLDCRLFEPARPAGERTAGRTGPKPAVTERVAGQLRKMHEKDPALLGSPKIKISALAEQLKVSRGTIQAALTIVRSELGIPTNSDTKLKPTPRRR
jgi:hypothetical protein